MSKRSFKPPKDIKQFWLAPHCGPGTLDPQDMCGFCGETRQECAKEATEFANEKHQLGPSKMGLGDNPTCGGSGLWCSECGRFWAQDSCGECDDLHLLASDGAEMKEKMGFAHCVCGKKLHKISEEDD